MDPVCRKNEILQTPENDEVGKPPTSTVGDPAGQPSMVLIGAVRGKGTIRAINGEKGRA
jgi:hypothetical protein